MPAFRRVFALLVVIVPVRVAVIVPTALAREPAIEHERMRGRP